MALPIIQRGYRREGNRWYRIDENGRKHYIDPNAKITLLDRADTIRLKDGTTAKYYKDSLGKTHVLFNNGREVIRDSSGDRFMRNYSINEDGNFISSEVDKDMFNSPPRKTNSPSKGTNSSVTNSSSAGRLPSGIDWGARFNSAIGALSDEDKNYLTGLGLDLSSAKALLSSINNKELGNLAVDNMWYTKSQEALNNILNNRNNQQTLPSLVNLDMWNMFRPNQGFRPNITFDIPRQTVLQPEVINNDIYDHAFNKRQTKQWLRDRGIDTRGLGRRTIRTWRDMLNNRDPWVEKFDAEYRPTNNTTTQVNTLTTPTLRTPVITQPTLKIPDYSDMLHNYALSLFVPSSRRGSKLIKTQDPVTKFKYKNGGSLNRIPFMLKGKDLPTAPKAEDRYKNGYKYGYRADGSLYLFPNPLYTIADVKGVRTDYPFMSNLGKIQRTIFYAGDNPMDTMYTEIPNSVFPVERKLRYADSKNKTPEYEILKHRFNTAWNLAK